MHASITTLDLQRNIDRIGEEGLTALGKALEVLSIDSGP
jgi:hypothetical protein